MRSFIAEALNVSVENVTAFVLVPLATRWFRFEVLDRRRYTFA
jgi:hypothetical protein